MGHLSEQELEDFWVCRMEPAAIRRAVHHLMSHCEPCRRRLLATCPPEPPFWERERLPDDAYDTAINNARRKVRKLLPRLLRDRERTKIGTALLRRKGGWANITGQEHCSFQGLWAHVEICLQQSFDHRHSNPREMLRLAQCAQEVADRLDSIPYGEALLLDLRARARAELGNALRVNERYQEAGTAFSEARHLLDQGTGDLFIQARIDDLEASLRRAQRQIPEALRLLEAVIRTHRRLDQKQLAARALMSKGNCLAYAGRSSEAVRAHREALEQLVAAHDPALVAIAKQNLLNALVDDRQFSEAGKFLLKSGLRQSFADDPINLLRLRWVEAKILAGRKRLTDAERAFEEVRKGFREWNLHYDEALAGMDLALVLVQQGKDAHQLATDLYREAAAKGAHPEAIRALRSFEVLCRFRVATPPHAERVRGFLDRLQQDPQLRFEPESVVFG